MPNATDPDTLRLVEWSCDNLRGKTMMDLVKIVFILNRPIEITFTVTEDNEEKISNITLK